MTAASLAAATPASRDRYVDLLRVGSLGVIMLGHWTMAVVAAAPDGTVKATNLLAIQPWLQPLTWLGWADLRPHRKLDLRTDHTAAHHRHHPAGCAVAPGRQLVG